MRVNIGQEKTGLSKILSRLVRVDRPGECFLSSHGSLAGQIWIADDFELTDAEIDEMVGDAAA